MRRRRHGIARRVHARKYSAGESGTFAWTGEFAYLGREEELKDVVVFLRRESSMLYLVGRSNDARLIDNLTLRLEREEHRR